MWVGRVFIPIFQSLLIQCFLFSSNSGVSSVVDPIWDFSLDLVNNAGNIENRMSTTMTKSSSSATAAAAAAIKTQSLSLYDCLELFTRTEHLGSSAKIKCNKCQSYQESTKQLSLKTLPIVVSFHLKRFEQTNKLNKKISTFVSFPTMIDMTPFTTSEIGHQARRQMINVQSNDGDTSAPAAEDDDDDDDDKDCRPPLKKMRKDNR